MWCSPIFGSWTFSATELYAGFYHRPYGCSVTALFPFSARTNTPARISSSQPVSLLNGSVPTASLACERCWPWILSLRVASLCEWLVDSQLVRYHPNLVRHLRCCVLKHVSESAGSQCNVLNVAGARSCGETHAVRCRRVSKLEKWVLRPLHACPAGMDSTNVGGSARGGSVAPAHHRGQGFHVLSLLRMLGTGWFTGDAARDVEMTAGGRNDMVQHPPAIAIVLSPLAHSPSNGALKIRGEAQSLTVELYFPRCSRSPCTSSL
ncbi:hypothetical protein FB451DRAFT_1518772 [Mycena latifolia]|nr:hypothetical protein FB451DRAFT_1518772 [Mycena latifolia]